MPWFLEYYLNTAYAPENRGPFKLASPGQSKVMTCYRFVATKFCTFCSTHFVYQQKLWKIRIFYEDGSQSSPNKRMFYEDNFLHTRTMKMFGDVLNFSLGAQYQLFKGQ